MVDAGVEEDVLEEVLGEERLLHFLGEPPVAAPMERHRAAAVRDDEFQGREIPEQIALDELHEGGRVAVDVMGARIMEARVARRRGPRPTPAAAARRRRGPPPGRWR